MDNQETPLKPKRIYPKIPEILHQRKDDILLGFDVLINGGLKIPNLELLEQLPKKTLAINLTEPIQKKIDFILKHSQEISINSIIAIALLMSELSINRAATDDRILTEAPFLTWPFLKTA